MSFAVIQTGGKQYKVSASEILRIERLENQEGKTVEFKNVLFLNDDKSTEIGNPNIKGAKVEATILKNTKNKTILVFKKRRRKNSRKKYGHRQPVSLIRITKIFSGNRKRENRFRWVVRQDLISSAHVEVPSPFPRQFAVRQRAGKRDELAAAFGRVHLAAPRPAAEAFWGR